MIPQSTVKSIFIKWKEHRSTTDPPRKGRTQKLSGGGGGVDPHEAKTITTEVV